MRLYRAFIAMHLKRSMAYRQSFFLSMLGQFLTSFTSLIGMLFLLGRFGTVLGYGVGECLLCGGVVLSSYSAAECFFRGFDSFSHLVREGRLDRLLLRPRSLMFQVLCDRMEFGRLGRFVQGAAMLIWGALAAPVRWTAYRICVLALMAAGGTAVFAGLFILQAALCFVTLEGLEAMNVFTDGAREYGGYPLDVYGRRVLRFCTYVVPYALFQYWPLQYLLDRSANPALGLLPLLTPLFLLPCLAMWRLGVRKYQSAGS